MKYQNNLFDRFAKIINKNSNSVKIALKINDN